MKYTLAEFFCGCGGTSRGFTRSGRFNVVLGNDVKAEALKTFAYNHQKDDIPPVTIRKDIRTLQVSEIEKTMQERGVRPGDLDCMIGGPPCQGFSQLRRAEHREEGKIVKFSGYSQLAHDPRNDLVLRYLEIAEALRPKFLVIENVPQMLNHGFDGRLGKLSETVINMLEKDLGYKVSVAILNAADYGVPQLRERAIFIASSVGSASMPPKTHADPNKLDQINSGRLPWITVEDAIKDLPEPSLHLEELGGASKKLYKNTFSDYAKSMHTSDCFPYNHISRTYKKSVLEIIEQMRPGQTWDTESQRMQSLYAKAIKKYAAKNGVTEKTAKKHLERDNKINSAFYKEYYWSAYSRLAWDSPSLTITANANFLGSGRFTHPDSNRGITMREAARLQSFDDDFRFITSDDDNLSTSRIGIGMDMIGEAVPPNLGLAIASHIASMLDAQPKMKPASQERKSRNSKKITREKEGAESC